MGKAANAKVGRRGKDTERFFYDLKEASGQEAKEVLVVTSQKSSQHPLLYYYYRDKFYSTASSIP